MMRSFFYAFAALLLQLLHIQSTTAQERTTDDRSQHFCAHEWTLRQPPPNPLKGGQTQAQLEKRIYDFLKQKSKAKTTSPSGVEGGGGAISPSGVGGGDGAVSPSGVGGAVGGVAVPNYVLPVVVHIIHDGGAENISDAQVLQGIQDLNDAYANVGYYDPSSGVDTKIQFCLAKRDPFGNATTGITRNQSPLTDMTLETDDITVKNLNRWTPTEYINIWLVREICSDAYGCGVAGYAYFPSSYGMPEDGIMMEAEFFGSTQGKSGVQVHEIGHYLGLYHTFQGGCTNDDCLAEGDRVCDTPPDQSTAWIPCAGSANSCNTDINSGLASDNDDLFQDYMDYSDFNCWSVFTEGQRERMSWFIENVRFSLLDAQGCLDPCTSALNASFSTTSTNINVGQTLNFIGTSTNSTTFTWQLDGGNFAFTPNASYTFTQVGTFEVCLKTGNADPNCTDKFCQTITVKCAVQPAFTTDNFYPMPGQAVNYTNTSANANAYEWRVNGTTVANSANFSTSFPAVGTNEVCLLASDGFCSEEFCLPVFVSDNPPSVDCDTTFLKTYGTLQDDELGHAILEIPASLGGGWLIGGGKGDSAMITRLDPNADILWTRAFDATPLEPDFIWDLKFDSENRVIGSGQTKVINNNVECFAFKYNLVTNTLLWVNELDLFDPAIEAYYSIFEKSPGGNYVVAGEVTPPGNPVTGCDGIILELNRNTGANVWQRNYHLGSCESFQRTIAYNNAIYATGRYNFDGGGTARMRPGVTKMDMSGNQLWSRLYLRAVTSSTTARLYSSDIRSDNGLVVLGNGDLNGTSIVNSTPFLFKTDNDGNLLWAMSYDITGGNTEVTTRLLNLPDGYLCLGYYLSGGDQDAFIFKTDKQGQLLWSKSYGSPSKLEDAFDLTWNGGLVYFTGKTKNSGAGATEDAYFTSISPDGESAGTADCNLFTDLPMTASAIANAYNAQHNLTDLNEDWGNFTNFPGIGETSVQSTTVCFSPCIDSCDFKPDAVFQLATALCAGADSLAVSVTVCNDAAFELPAGTPLTFYLGNPTSIAAAVAGTFALPEKVKMGECLTFTFHVAAQPNTTIFVMLDDDGTTPRPFNLSTFGNEEECDFTNNLGSFHLDFDAPVLDLGADKLMCQFGVTVLDAGAGFASYRWQDGSIEQTYTAFNPGTYWVVATDSCGGEQSDTVNVTIDPATVLELGADVSVCEGGSHQFSVSGFAEFAWSPADYLSCTTCPNPTTTPLAAITYYLVATNAEGCVTSDSVQVTVSPAYESVADAILCEGDTLIIFGMVVTQAGDFTQTFTATNGCDSIHTVSVGVLPKAFTSENVTICQGQTADIFGVPTGTAGTFSMTFQGFNTCDSTHTITLNVLPGAATSEAILICEGDTVSVFGNPVSAAGTFSQTFTASDGCDSTHTVTVSVLPVVATSEARFICAGETTDIFGAPIGVAGSYSETFTAANGCDSVHTIVLGVNPLIWLAFLVNDVTCFGGSNGSVVAQASGGVGGFTFQWSNGADTSTIGNLVEGEYFVTATDATGCSVSEGAAVFQPGAVVVAATTTNLTCNSPGTATAMAFGGTSPYLFLWSNGATTASIGGLSAGAFGVTATDAAGCTGTASVQFTGSLAPQASISIDTLLTEANPDGGALSASATGGNPPFSFAWNTGDSTAMLDSLSSGQYIVTVTDAAGCTARDTAYLFVPACTGGKIWDDFNRDGCQNGGLLESGFAGVKLFLSGTDIWGNAISDSTFSAQNGEYIFENLPPGDYQVHLVKPAGFNLSAPNACSDDFLDSDFNVTTGISIGFIHLVEGHCCLVVDGGLFDACLNVTNIGTICCNQTICGPGNDPAPITGTPASGSGGAVLYLWMKSTDSPVFNSGTWQIETDAAGQPVTTMSYDPGPLSQTTWFTRCVKGTGCADWLESNIVEITVDDVAVAAISGSNSPCVGIPATYSTAANSPGATFLWTFSPGATPATSNQPTVQVTWSQAGSANVSLTVVYAGCTSTDALPISVSNSPVYCGTGLVVPGNSEIGNWEIEGGAQFTVYPNPVGERLTIAWAAALETSATVELMALEGKVLRRVAAEEGFSEIGVDVSDLLPGMYLLRVRSAEERVVKWIKE